MDATHISSYFASDQMDVLKFCGCESTDYNNGFHTFESFKVFQSLREYVMKYRAGRIFIKL